MSQFKPFENNSQQQTIGNDDAGEILFSNDDEMVVLEGRLEISKTKASLDHIKYIISSLNASADAINKALQKNNKSAAKIS